MRDIIGGNEALLVAVGMCMAEYPKLRIVALRNSQPALVWGQATHDTLDGLNQSLSVREIISVAAGELERCGRADWRMLDEYTFSLIPTMFDIYMKNRESWSAFTYYLQRLNNVKYKMKEGVFSGPLEFTLNPVTGKKVKANLGIIKELSEAGVITDCRITSVNCRLSFAHTQIIKFLCDTGSWLELYVFSVLRKSGLFSDIEINPVIIWDNDEDDDDTINEVDLIAMRGITPIFISCKSGIPSNDAVNEIGTIARRFGNYSAKAVLVTACDMDRDAPSVLKRAGNLSVTILDVFMLGKNFRVLYCKSLDCIIVSYDLFQEPVD